MIRRQFILDLHNELIVDNFAGGGGASTAIELALGRNVDHAINHCAKALGMHRINHPQTVHHCEDIFDIDPLKVTEGRPVGLAHFSPDCKHFSKAKGGKPLDKRIRGLVLVMLKWAKIRSRVMTMENVEEITTWGPLKRMEKNGEVGWYPDPDQKGRTWKAFLDILSVGIAADHPDLPEILSVLDGTVTIEDCVRGFGYHYEAREVRACDYGTPETNFGAPTIRKRLFMVARRDGKPIVWPEPTRYSPKDKTAPKGARPWRTIAECLDWNLPCPSIFLTGAAAKAAKCRRPLAPSTLRRIAAGIDRYVLRSKEPFLVSLTHQGGDRIEPVSEPAKTITGAHRGEKALVSPVVQKFHGSHQGRSDGASRNRPVTEPLMVQDTEPRFAVTEASLAPFVTEHANGSSQRNMGADEPMRTQCSQVKGGHFALVSPVVVNTSNGKFDEAPSRARSTEEPLSPVTTSPKFAMVTGTLVHTAHGDQDKNGKKRGRGAHDLCEPMPAVLASPDGALASAVLVGAGGPGYSGKPKPVDAPMNAQTTENHAAVASVNLVKLRGDTTSHLHAPPITDPAHTASAGGQHHGLIAAHLTKFVTGAVGQDLRQPAPTIVAGSHSPDTHGGAATPQGVVAAYLAQHNAGFNETVGHEATEPVSTISAKGSQQQVVAASLAAYYGNDEDGQAVTEPARTVTTKERFGFVESTAVSPMTDEQIAGARCVAAFLRAHGVEFEGEFATVREYVIVDIGMRMLTPRELFKAQGFPESYVIDRAWIIDPKTCAIQEVSLTKEEQIRMCGNSVSPPPYAAIVAANVPELASWFKGERPKSKVRRQQVLQPA